MDSSLSIAIEIGNIGMIKDTYNSLMRLSYSRGDYKQAYEYYELFSKAKDSLINQENLKATAMMQSQFDLERKDNEIKLLNKENEVRSERALAESRKQQIIIWSVIGILLVVGLFSLLIYNRWKLTINQKQIIEKQQRSILDSIRYAKHIQKTVIPGEEEVRSILPFESFILFQPKDIVSGDFYWVSSVKNNGSEKYVVAAGDCTGHGAPGAFLTMMGSMLLKEVIGKNILEPAEILTHIHHGVTATLSRGKEMDAAGDGMDIAVCVIDQTARTVSYAGAMLSAYVFSPEKNKIEVLKADSVSIGGLYSGAEEISFHQHTIPLEHHACLYLFSDGYADQFSKETKTRFGSKRFREMLEKNGPLPMSAQKENILNEWNEWKGDRAQLDDILLMGIRL